MVHLVFIDDRDTIIFALYLAPVELARKVCDVHVGSVASQRDEFGLDGQFILGGDDVPRLDLRDHRFDGPILIPNVVLFQLLDILSVDGCKDGLNHHGVHHLLEGVLLTLDLLVRLDLEDLVPIYVVPDFRVEEFGICEPLAVEGVVPGDETNFGLAEDEREETLTSTPFGGCKMAHNGQALIGEVSHRVEGELLHN